MPLLIRLITMAATAVTVLSSLLGGVLEPLKES